MSHDQHQPTTEFQAPLPEEIDAYLANYRVDTLLATGGMGAVYQGTQISLDRPVAIKVLPRELSAQPEFRDSFEKEAKLMARLNHPNLIGVYDFGDIDGMLFIAMEFVNGQTLFAAHHGYRVELTGALRVTASICRGLENAHQAGILHRDIKPANIFYNQYGEPKIGDFGLARPSSDVESGVIFGTPGYTAPEVVASPQSVGPAADVFSVGVLLYELITATLPQEPYQVIDPISRPPASVDAIIQKSIHPDPAVRYQTAGEFAQAIDAVLVAVQDPQYAIAQKLQVPVTEAPVALPLQTPSADAPATSVQAQAPSKKSGLGFARFAIILVLLGGIYGAIELKKSKEDRITDVEAKQDETIEKINEINEETKKIVADERARYERLKKTSKKKTQKGQEPPLSPLPPLDIDQSPEYSKLRAKAEELVTAKNNKYYEQMEAVSDNMLWDLEILADKLSEEDQQSEANNIEVIKDSIDPITFKIDRFSSDVSDNEKINTLVNSSIDKQGKITAGYEEEIDVIRKHFIKHVTTLRKGFRTTKQRVEEKDASRILKRAGESPRSFATMF
ncbi:serine/threonine protein kinase [Rubritalea marina]|uniref:serine/threonine protein kinase n=1 Tax=Rubritalea marina TaxID=361055 RepID=UPI00039A1164|nr:serine/threonine-protein kinase [Rubritalea marina]